jgi:DNA-binding NarL/FixJ family response regulator
LGGINVVFLKSGGGKLIMAEKKRIFIAEDHTILREGLKSILTSNTDCEVIGEADDGREAIRGVDKYKPDLIILDLSMPRMNGLEAIKEIKKISPKTRIIILTIHDTEEYILPALGAGADGYLLKYTTQDELLTGIKRVLEGKSYLSPAISDQVIQGYLGEGKRLKTKSSWDTVTKQERRVLKMIAEGYKNKDIADYLCISDKTVAKHRANLMQKLDLHSISALTTFAIGKGLIDRK